MPAQQVLRIFFKLFPPFASAAQSDSVRRPIRFRPPSNQIPFAVRSDSVRRPMIKSNKSHYISTAPSTLTAALQPFFRYIRL